MTVPQMPPWGDCARRIPSGVRLARRESTGAGEHGGSTGVGAVAASLPVEMDTSNARVLTWFAVLVLCFQLTACELAKGIFKAGIWVGVLGVVVVLALVGWGISRLGR
jgi:hypothetical protein